MENTSLYSIGTQGFMNTITKDYNKFGSNLFLINISTLLRNILSENTDNLQGVYERIRVEIRNIGIELSNIVNSNNDTATIIFYMFDYYSMISPTKIRPLTSKSRQDLNLYTKSIFKDAYKIFGAVRSFNLMSSDMHIVLVNNKTDPYIKLQSLVKSITHNRKAVMLSSFPIDWHVRMMFRKFSIINSFTGDALALNKISEKVFGKNYSSVPFYIKTHELYGDSILINPVLKPNEKKKINELAHKEKWNHKSENYINKELRNLGVI